jgi:hypothetical protein
MLFVSYGSVDYGGAQGLGAEAAAEWAQYADDSGTPYW